ncbi:SAM dependent carboxyl methyltransferase [Dillenia turbinata]|uniref:SAM dependent carboxyl methyltransferase n=1 Tax=Dillenia turbinata TaxID=194707 RepID=A0AAN8ZD47_9MAGN
MAASAETYPMKAGTGPSSYAHNSNLQACVSLFLISSASTPVRTAAEKLRGIITAAIVENLDMSHLSPPSNQYCIADLGCSTGPNTFFTVNAIMEATKHRCDQENADDHLPEFLVFFNDHVSNDFNTLFVSLPTDGKYSAAGVPGSFHRRLFPKGSINFFNTSYALQWISNTPKELSDLNSPACNKGKITYADAHNEVVEAFASQFAKDMDSFLLSDLNSPACNKGKITYADAHNEVVEAFASQFAKDMDSFLVARAQELVPGGLLSILIPCPPDGMHPSKSPFGLLLEPLESSFVGMVNELDFGSWGANGVPHPLVRAGGQALELQQGRLNKDELDSFNIPLYSPSASELRLLVQHNGCFSIARSEEMRHDPLPRISPQSMRAWYEATLSKNFGIEIIDEVFKRYAEKVEGCSFIRDEEGIACQLFILLKRN